MELVFYCNIDRPMYILDYRKMAPKMFPKLLHHHTFGVVLPIVRKMG